MDVNISLEMTVKGVDKEVVLLGKDGLPDCVKIIITNGLKQTGYKSVINDIKILSVGGAE